MCIQSKKSSIQRRKKYFSDKKNRTVSASPDFEINCQCFHIYDDHRIFLERIHARRILNSKEGKKNHTACTVMSVVYLMTYLKCTPHAHRL